MTLVQTYNALRMASGRAQVVGSGGLIVPGYSDDVTLENEGFLTPSSREERRRELTANRVFVSLPSQETPEDYSYTASYQVQGDRTSRSTIVIRDTSFAELGNLTITYRGGQSNSSGGQ